MELVSRTSNDDVPRLRLISQNYDRFSGSDWTETINEEVSKHCSAHYDEGQAAWPSPYQDLPLFQAWRSAAAVDRRIEVLGLRDFRKLVSKLPHSAEAALFVLLQQSEVPPSLWHEYLLCVALTLPGWSAWTKYKSNESTKNGFENADFAGLLAMRIAYDVAVSKQFDFHVAPRTNTPHDESRASDALTRLTLLRANEISRRDRVLGGISSAVKIRKKSAPSQSATRTLAQMVFCIDVRSERIRRNLEQTSTEIETFGFAGFFGLPFEYVRLGDNAGTNQLPVLLDPKFQVYEDIRGDSEDHGVAAGQRRSKICNLRQFWKTFQTSAVSCFAFVESTGLFYAQKLLSRTLGRPSKCSHHDGVHASDQPKLGPSFRDLKRQGIGTSEQVDMAESILRGIGITQDFAQLVVLCGHGATTENNPLQAGLDCGGRFGVSSVSLRRSSKSPISGSSRCRR